MESQRVRGVTWECKCGRGCLSTNLHELSVQAGEEGEGHS